MTPTAVSEMKPFYAYTFLVWDTCRVTVHADNFTTAVRKASDALSMSDTSVFKIISVNEVGY